MSRGAIRPGWAGSMMTATCGCSWVCGARGVAWTTIHRPDWERRRTVAGSPSRARLAAATIDDGRRAVEGLPSGRSARRCSTLAEAEITSKDAVSTSSPGASGSSISFASAVSRARRAPSARWREAARTNALSASSKSGRSTWRQRPMAPQVSPPAERRAQIISWSPPYLLFSTHRGLLVGSPPVASCSVEIPAADRVTSARVLTSSA